MWLYGIASDIQWSVLTAVAYTSYNSFSIATITENNPDYVCAIVAKMCELSVSAHRKTIARRISHLLTVVHHTNLAWEQGRI